MTDYPHVFSTISGGCAPHPWQATLAGERSCGDRLIRIPTGFGKTLGVFGAWFFNRVVREDEQWPRRLVWCLPMRVLVEQTGTVLREALRQRDRLWDGKDSHAGRVGLHVLMGGSDSQDWHLYPEADAVLVGTQDMLLSRALMRGYGSSRARWPIEYGLLNQDALWVLDEVQLMDVGLVTSAQTQAFRLMAPESLRPCHSWWMSATLQRSWLETVDSRSTIASSARSRLPDEERRGELWEATFKTLCVERAEGLEEWVRLVSTSWRDHGRGGLTLVVVNTVKTACALHAKLCNELEGEEISSSDIHLVHSRFRPHERARWPAFFEAPVPETGRVIVSTQVVEAGVDLDAKLLVSEIAPWPSLVQRFGRAARRGGRARILVVDTAAGDDRTAAPYTLAEIDAARRALERLEEVSPRALEVFESGLDMDEIEELYPYAPQHVILETEWRELFDTTADLSGADVDVSRFIRSGEERDALVFWEEIEAGASPGSECQPARDALCAVPFLAARDWIFARGSARRGLRAWVWDWIDGRWTCPVREKVIPGALVLVDAACGGYDPARGWDPNSRKSVMPVPALDPARAENRADAWRDSEALSAREWKTIATHGTEVVALIDFLALALGLSERFTKVLRLSAVWHDAGKAHRAFQGSIRAEDRPSRDDLAKAPAGAWSRVYRYTEAETGERRGGFRHELASALALFSVIERGPVDHPSRLGSCLAHLDAAAMTPRVGESVEESSDAGRAVLDLEDARDFDLLVYLVASHHGKVRVGLHATESDQNYVDRDGRGQPISGVREGDVLPRTRLGECEESFVGPFELTLEPAFLGLSPRTGRSWTERVLGLLNSFGPAALGFLEACLRAADVRASRLSSSDPLLEEGGTS